MSKCARENQSITVNQGREQYKLTFQIGFKDIPGKPLNGIINWQNVDPLTILHILALMHWYYITEPDPQVWPDNLIHPYLGLLTCVISKSNTDCISPFLALKCISQCQLLLSFVHIQVDSVARKRPETLFMCHKLGDPNFNHYSLKRVPWFTFTYMPKITWKAP